MKDKHRARDKEAAHHAAPDEAKREESSPEDGAQHLESHRTAIFVRSALVGIATALPVPGLGDMLAAALSRGLIYHVAHLRYIDIDEEAAEAITAPTVKKQRLNILSMVGGVATLLRRRGMMRRLFTGLAVLNGVEAASRMFHMAMLLDHYFARHHNGVAISLEEAKRVRRTIDEATDLAQREMTALMLDQVISSAMRVLQAVPPWVWAQLTRADAAPALPALMALARQARTWLGSLSVQRYIGHVIGSFDKKWSEASPAT